MIFFVNSSVKTEERFDLAKFMEFVNGDYDPLTSYLLNRLHELPVSAKFKTLGHENLPDLLSYDIYDTEQYWELLLFYNRKLGFDDLKDNEEIKVFDLEQLEETFISLRTKQQALKKSSTGIISTETQVTNNNQGDPQIIISLTAPTNIKAIWKKPNENNLFVFDSIRNIWVSTFEKTFLTAIGFDSVTNQYLFSLEGQNTSLIPILVDKKICITRVVIQSENSINYNIFIQDFETDNNIVQISAIDINTIKNDLNIILNENSTIKIYLAGTNISNPKVTFFYREVG
jgi:hypothetical protein